LFDACCMCSSLFLRGSLLPKTRSVSRGATTFEIFRREVPLVESEPGESSERGRRIIRSAISITCSSACKSTCKLRDLKSSAPIPDQGLIRARLRPSGTICVIPIGGQPGGGRLPFVNSLRDPGFASRVATCFDISWVGNGFGNGEW